MRDLSRAYFDRTDAEIGLARYEYVRCLTPQSFSALWERNLRGEGTFDELVDLAIAARVESTGSSSAGRDGADQRDAPGQGASQEGRTALPDATATQCDNGVWTHDTPKVSGFYWMRTHDGDEWIEPYICEFAKDTYTGKVWNLGNSEEPVFDTDFQYSGAPIQPPVESTAPPTALEAQQEGAMPPALVERGIERRQHREIQFVENGKPTRFRFASQRWNDWSFDRRIKDRRRAT